MTPTDTGMLVLALIVAIPAFWVLLFFVVKGAMLAAIRQHRREIKAEAAQTAKASA
ncbi:hypothetical protein EV379_0900 [Microterricola gilva]|uniref:Uncharacterized protein n=1 Tax=Microterricola gilva TaxID=393267 RepID=A0A4Q8AJE8_9MICO|nr:hypothetical protein [Microterricola gilva]RZU64597.1 hypothetical protein EV379_0900 [Microterricola gilva]